MKAHATVKKSSSESTPTQSNQKNSTTAVSNTFLSNRAVSASNHTLLQRKCACGGGCPHCQTSFPTNTKLKISRPENVYEQEADRVAEEVMRIPSTTVLHKKNKNYEESALHTQPLVQKKVSSVGDKTVVPDIVHEVLQSPGQPLEKDTRQFMENRFEQDFSQVRIHTGRRAAHSTQAVSAHAFTVGKNIVFGKNQYRPQNPEGRKLVAHELTHVIQQRHDSSNYLARDEDEQIAQSSVSLVFLSCATNTINFYTSQGVFSYSLNNCDLSDGDYIASVSVEDSEITFDLGDAVEAGTRFNFSYSVAPRQQNPSTLFRGQDTVRIVASSGTGTIGGEPFVIADLPITFTGDILDTPLSLSSDSPILADSLSSSPSSGVPSFPATTTGLSLHVLASGDLSWLQSGDAARRVLSRQYWSPLVPSQGTITLDRLLNELPRDLEPRITSELAQGRPLSWVRRGFSDAELRSIPDIVRRLDTHGMASLAEHELDVLMRAASTHVGGSSPGSPLVSFTDPNIPDADLGFLAERRYRVRVEMPRSSVLDLGDTPFTREAASRGFRDLPNLEEAELAVTTNHRGRIVSVQQLDGSTNQSFLMRHSSKIRWGGRALFVVGIGLSAHRVVEASPEERAVVIGEELGGQAGGALGAAGAVAGCVAFGVATGGVGLFLCGLAGGFAGGALGSSLGGSLTREFNGIEDDAPCPSCHAMQREWQSASQFDLLRNSGLGDRQMALPGSALTNGTGNSAIEPLTTEELELIQRWIER